jgi:ATP-dependent protease HslVU (ClpYQ) peptidase subunit
VPVAYSQVTSGEFSPLCGSDDDDGGSYLLVSAKKVMCLEADKMVPYPVAKTFAIGSGCKYAMAAMACGKTPAEAIKVAAKLDPFTGGAVRTLSV